MRESGPRLTSEIVCVYICTYVLYVVQLSLLCLHIVEFVILFYLKNGKGCTEIVFNVLPWTNK